MSDFSEAVERLRTNYARRNDRTLDLDTLTREHEKAMVSVSQLPMLSERSDALELTNDQLNAMVDVACEHDDCPLVCAGGYGCPQSDDGPVPDCGHTLAHPDAYPECVAARRSWLEAEALKRLGVADDADAHAG